MLNKVQSQSPFKSRGDRSLPGVEEARGYSLNPLLKVGEIEERCQGVSHIFNRLNPLLKVGEIEE